MIKVDCVSNKAKQVLVNIKPSAQKSNKTVNAFLKSGLGLPSKVALGSAAALVADTFVGKCSDYEYYDPCQDIVFYPAG